MPFVGWDSGSQTFGLSTEKVIQGALCTKYTAVALILELKLQQTGGMMDYFGTVDYKNLIHESQLL